MNKLRFLMPIGLLAIVAGFGVAVMLLWNWLMPSLFGLATVNFWQSLGLLVLCRILFGSFKPWHHKKCRTHGEGVRNHLREKWQKMTPDERKEFVNKRKEHFGRGGFFGRPDFDLFTTDEDSPKDRE